MHIDVRFYSELKRKKKKNTSPDFSIPIRIVVYYFWIWIIAFPGLLNIAKSHLQWIGLAPLIESCCDVPLRLPHCIAAYFLTKERKYIFTTNATCRLKGNCCKMRAILNSYSTALELSPEYPRALPISRKGVWCFSCFYCNQPALHSNAQANWYLHLRPCKTLFLRK